MAARTVESVISLEEDHELDPDKVVLLALFGRYIQEFPFGENERVIHEWLLHVVGNVNLLFASRPRLKLERTILP